MRRQCRERGRVFRSYGVDGGSGRHASGMTILQTLLESACLFMETFPWAQFAEGLARQDVMKLDAVLRAHLRLLPETDSHAAPAGRGSV